MIGFLSGGTPVGYAPYATALRQGLKESGYIEGQNVAIEYRWAEGQNDRKLTCGLSGRNAAGSKPAFPSPPPPRPIHAVTGVW